MFVKWASKSVPASAQVAQQTRVVQSDLECETSIEALSFHVQSSVSIP